jgi:hypothetical protein
MANSSGQLPVVVSTGFLCLALGVGITVVTMVSLGFRQADRQQTPEEIMAEARSYMTKDADPRAAIMRENMQGKKGGTGGKKGGFGPTSKAYLTMLVAKLDVLTAKPLSVELTDDQRAKVREQLKGLAGEDDLSEDDAKERLDKLLRILQPQKATLEEAGFLWPGGGFQLPMNTADNPFKEGTHADHLKNLDKRLEPAK